MYTTPLFNMNQLQKVSKKMLVNQINLKIYNLHIFTFIYILPFSISVIDSFKKMLYSFYKCYIQMLYSLI